MARNDPIFARVDISLLYDPKLRKLSMAHKWFYETCYLSSVEVRSELLPPQYDLSALTDRAGGDTRTCKIALQKCCDIGLLEMTPEGLIRVIGTRENHKKLDWNEYTPPSPCRDDTGLKKREREENEIETERERFAQPVPPPPEPTASAPLKLTRPQTSLVDEKRKFLLEGRILEIDGPGNALRRMIGKGWEKNETVILHIRDLDLIRECFAYALAWKECNQHAADKVAGVFINQLKELLGNRAA